MKSKSAAKPVKPALKPAPKQLARVLPHKPKPSPVKPAKRPRPTQPALPMDPSPSLLSADERNRAVAAAWLILRDDIDQDSAILLTSPDNMAAEDLIALAIEAAAQPEGIRDAIVELAEPIAATIVITTVDAALDEAALKDTDPAKWPEFPLASTAPGAQSFAHMLALCADERRIARELKKLAEERKVIKLTLLAAMKAARLTHARVGTYSAFVYRGMAGGGLDDRLLLAAGVTADQIVAGRKPGKPTEDVRFAGKNADDDGVGGGE